jgi:hypothetical protein
MGRFNREQTKLPKLCKICDDPIDPIHSGNVCRVHKHVCHNCLKSYILNEMRELQVPCVCPFPNCKEPIYEHRIQYSLREHQYARYNELCGKVEILKDPLGYCPKCEKKIATGRTKNDFKCSFCFTKFCGDCRSPEHGNIACDTFESYKFSSTGKSCPNCHHFVERTEGCRHITCICNTHFCYACGGEYSVNSVNACNCFSYLFHHLLPQDTAAVVNPAWDQVIIQPLTQIETGNQPQPLTQQEQFVMLFLWVCFFFVLARIYYLEVLKLLV